MRGYSDNATFRDGRSAGPNWRYRGTLTREQWLLSEMRIIASLRLDEQLSDTEILERTALTNPFQYPTEREIKSITQACLLRLDNLSENENMRRELEKLICHGTPIQARETNLYAMMRTYRLVWEFMIAVVGKKLQARDMQLAKHEIAVFINGINAQSDTVAGWSDATRNKIRQVLTKSLVQAGYLDTSRSTELHAPLLDPLLEQLIVSNGDAAALPAFNCLDRTEG